jgi:hypothetical protein
MRTPWPKLPYGAFHDTYASLHRYAQIAGKVQLALTPHTNHFWNVTFFVTPRGLVTPTIPYEDRRFTIAFDFLDHHVIIRSSDGGTRALAFVPRTVASFYREVMAMLDSLGIRVRIWDHPVEMVEDAVPFADDVMHTTYNPELVAKWFAILAETNSVLSEFRGRFLGKCSPVHFFWGSFDLAVSRFSGRRAMVPEGADPISRESYSHEVSSAGFWPGDARFQQAAFYAYSAPMPEGFDKARIRPEIAIWHPMLREYLLPYEAVRRAGDPRALLLDFFQSAYEAGADLGGWDRESLERPEARIKKPGAWPEPPQPVAGGHA